MVSGPASGPCPARSLRSAPGLAALDKGGNAALASMCAPAGSCSAGGSYTDGAGDRQVFLVSKS